MTVRTERLAKRFRSLEAVSDFSIEVPEGSIFALVGPNGAGKTTAIKTLLNILEKSPVHGYLFRAGSKPAWQLLTFRRAAYAQVRDRRLDVRARVAARLLRSGEAVWIGIGKDPIAALRAGLCRASIVEDPFEQSMLKVLCTSPEAFPKNVAVKAVDPATGSEWRHALMDSLPHVPYPVLTWLSPLHRGQTFIHVTDHPIDQPGSRWRMPREALPRVKIELTPIEVAGCAVLDYELRGIRPSEFRIEPKKGQLAVK